jgi:hypothetical protein
MKIAFKWKSSAEKLILKINGFWDFENKNYHFSFLKCYQMFYYAL